MNKENMNKLLEYFKAGAPHIEFDMSKGLVPTLKYYEGEDLIPEDCGTTCCIAGAAAMLSGRAKGFEEVDDEAPWNVVSSIAEEWLGLNSSEAHALFEPFKWEPYSAMNSKRRELTVADAVTAIERAIEGKYPWTHVESEW